MMVTVHRRRKSKLERFKEYIIETWRNKLFAVMFMAIGWFMVVVDNDATCLVLMTILGVPLFFSRKNHIY